MGNAENGRPTFVGGGWVVQNKRAAGTKKIPGTISFSPPGGAPRTLRTDSVPPRMASKPLPLKGLSPYEQQQTIGARAVYSSPSRWTARPACYTLRTSAARVCAPFVRVNCMGTGVWEGVCVCRTCSLLSRRRRRSLSLAATRSRPRRRSLAPSPSLSLWPSPSLASPRTSCRRSRSCDSLSRLAPHVSNGGAEQVCVYICTYTHTHTHTHINLATDKLHAAQERLIGLHMAPQPGLKVVLSKQVCVCGSVLISFLARPDLLPRSSLFPSSLVLYLPACLPTDSH